jgi:hypothetical protein
MENHGAWAEICAPFFLRNSANCWALFNVYLRRSKHFVGWISDSASTAFAGCTDAYPAYAALFDQEAE